MFHPGMARQPRLSPTSRSAWAEPATCQGCCLHHRRPWRFPAVEALVLKEAQPALPTHPYQYPKASVTPRSCLMPVLSGPRVFSHSSPSPNNDPPTSQTGKLILQGPAQMASSWKSSLIFPTVPTAPADSAAPSPTFPQYIPRF